MCMLLMPKHCEYGLRRWPYAREHVLIQHALHALWAYNLYVYVILLYMYAFRNYIPDPQCLPPAHAK